MFTVYYIFLSHALFLWQNTPEMDSLMCTRDEIDTRFKQSCHIRVWHERIHLVNSKCEVLNLIHESTSACWNKLIWETMKQFFFFKIYSTCIGKLIKFFNKNDWLLMQWKTGKVYQIFLACNRKLNLVIIQ